MRLIFGKKFIIKKIVMMIRSSLHCFVTLAQCQIRHYTTPIKYVEYEKCQWEHFSTLNSFSISFEKYIYKISRRFENGSSKNQPKLILILLTDFLRQEISSEYLFLILLRFFRLSQMS